jgi:histidine triad (HIT) family protein
MEDCVFCQIVSGKRPAIKIWEDEKFLAMLDIFPNTPGMTVVLSKNHYDSYLNDMKEEVRGQFMIAARKVCELLDRSLGTERTAIVMEGLGVNHAHLKLYPMHSLAKVLAEDHDQEFFSEEYPGHVDTRRGPQMAEEQLKSIAEKIKEVNLK